MAKSPRLIPVVDVMGGQIVRAVGGRRSEYAPIVSRLATFGEFSISLLHLRRAADNAKDLYVADLDGIMSTGRVSFRVFDWLLTSQTPVYLDFGLRTFDYRTVADAVDIRAGVQLIVATETCADPAIFEHLAQDFPQVPVTVSIDLRAGEVVAAMPQWGRTVQDAAAYAVDRGVRSLIVLDTSAVGERAGPTTVKTCERLRRNFPNVQLISGGGVRNRADVNRLGYAGVDAVLVSTALHDETLTPDS